MQPLPEQRSRILSGLLWASSVQYFRKSCRRSSFSSLATRLVYASVSGLFKSAYAPSRDGLLMTCLEINTPGRHLISNSPKGWEPRMYCKGSPHSLRLQSSRSFSRARNGDESLHSATCSRIHLSSLIAEGRSRVARSVKGSSDEIL